MAKRSRNNRRNRAPQPQRSVGRVFNIPYAKPSSLPRSPIVNQLVDRRSFYPLRKLPVRPIYTRKGLPARINTSIRKGNLYASKYFTLPEHIAPCVRRKTRKEVLFAYGYGGRKLNTRRVRRNSTSQIKC